jgi:hypothetical protein
MDKVRFGRALGYGARHTAKAIYKAVDAARAPGADGTATKPVAEQPAAAQPAAQAAQPPTQAAQPAAQVRQPRPTAASLQPQTVAKHAKGLGKSVWTPVARFSGVLWLQVTGSVYAVIALAMGQAVWMRRADLRAPMHSAGAERAYLLAAIFALFAYFAVSSFVRAARLEKR